MKSNRLKPGVLVGACIAALVSISGCSPTDGAVQRQTIANVGSDTMLQLAMSWSEAYRATEPGVNVEVNGGGSGVGIAGLINGSVELANSSRALEEKEIADLQAKQAKQPMEFMVGYDALSIYVHKDNPLNEISMEQLSEVYRQGGKIKNWSELGVKAIPGAKGDEIVVISRQNNSGTHHYFKEAVVGKKNELRPDTVNQNGSADVVNLVGTTPNAIGYSGMGYRTAGVKVLKVSKKSGEPAVAPDIASALDKTYPIARPMFVYTAGEPAPHIRKYIDWMLSDVGQKILRDNGYVPLPKR